MVLEAETVEEEVEVSEVVPVEARKAKVAVATEEVGKVENSNYQHNYTNLEIEHRNSHIFDNKHRKFELLHLITIDLRILFLLLHLLCLSNEHAEILFLSLGQYYRLQH